MSYSLTRIFANFQKEVLELNQLVIQLSRQSKSLTRDVQIEGCFIRLVVNWEKFVEEYFLRSMCGAETRSGKKIKPKIPCCKDRETAFQRLHIKHESRDKDYLGWLEYKNIKRRAEDFFYLNSRVHKVYESPDKLYALQTIRNAIVHASEVSLNKFKGLVRDNMDGYLRTLDPSTAELLVLNSIRQPKIIFLLYSDYFLSLADKLSM